MSAISILIKPASGNCNLSCEYCFYKDSMSKRTEKNCKFMAEETLEEVIKKALAKAKGTCTIAYQGGEPTLRGIEFFKKAIAYEKKYNINNVKINHSLQTNGYLIDEHWAKFLSENNFLVGVSLDGIKETNDLYRRDINGMGTFNRVMEAINLFKKYKVDFNILTVVNRSTAQETKKIYEFYKEQNFKYLQFIPCMDPIYDEPGKNNYSIEPKEYGEFLINLFDLWYEELLRGTQPYIRQFENYIQILFGFSPESCDMKGYCSKQYVVEANGDVYPCDFYTLDAFKLGNLLENSFEEIDSTREKIRFIEESKTYNDKCRECRYFRICRGGCRRNKNENNEQYFCEAYKIFFKGRVHILEHIVKTIKENYTLNNIK